MSSPLMTPPLNTTVVNGYGTSISRPSSAQSVRTRERPSLTAHAPRGLNGPTSGRPISFIAPVHGDYKQYRPSLWNIIKLFISQLVSVAVSSVFLVAVVGWALLAEISKGLPRRWRPVKAATFPWDDHDRWKNEDCVKDVRYYAHAVGFDIVDEEAETEDDYYLRCYLWCPCVVFTLTHILGSIAS